MYDSRSQAVAREEVGIDTQREPAPAAGVGLPDLTIWCGDRAHTAPADRGPVTLGRQSPAQLIIDDPRISRVHLRVQPDAGEWVAVDNSSNGTYVDGVRQVSFVVADGMTARLGETDGIPVHFAFTDASAETRAQDSAELSGERTDWVPEGEVDEGIARAGAAVAARREELGIAQRTLARNKIMNAGALISFEKGRSWPRRGTLAKLEEVLQWPPGTIERIRRGEGVEDLETTTAMPAAPRRPSAVAGPATDPPGATTLGNTVGAPLLAQTIELALSNILARVDALPATADPGFSAAAFGLLADLRRLDTMATKALHSTTGAREIALALSTVRRRYEELTLRAATAPGATLGQRLFAARRSANLTEQETANAIGVPPATIAAAEAESPVGARQAAALEDFIAMLSGRARRG